MKMNVNKIFLLLVLFLFPMVVAPSAGFQGAATSGFSGSTNYWQYSSPTFDRIYAGQIQDYWPILTRMETDQCEATSDFIIGIPPGGCSPAVVRSDLLAEQNVPVFCQLYAIKVNPLIKVANIKSISFKGKYPEEIAGISFHPARAAVRSYTTLLGDPVTENIGYVVIILKRNSVEKNMEEWVAGNLTATIRYDAEDAFGTGRADYYLPLLSDDEWSTDYERYSFWYGKGYLRLKSQAGGNARIEVLKNKDSVVRSFSLNEGQTGELLYFPGYYCMAGLKVKLNGIVAPEESALLNIDGEEFWVREGSKILNDQCRISKVDANGRFGNITIVCPGERLILDIKEDKSAAKPKDEMGDYVFFVKGNDAVTELIEEYASVTKEPLEETYGEEALFEQIILAGNIGKFETQAALMNTFLDKYPSSVLAERVRYGLGRLNGTDFSNSYASVITSNKFHSISVVDFSDFDEEDKNVDLTIGTKDFNAVNEGTDIEIAPNENISIREITPNQIRVEYTQKSNKGEIVSRDNAIIAEGSYAMLGGREVYVRNINLSAIAHVTLIPEVKATKTEADFTFKIGIEKRAIELSPNKTKNMLENLEKTIKKWKDINDKLNNLVKGWKAACFATSGVLMVKNMMSGFSGEALAREKVMEKYKQVCATNFSEMSRTQCYNHLESNINSEIDTMTGALNSVNDDLDNLLKGEGTTTSGLFGEGTVTNQTKYVEDLKKTLGSDWSYTHPDVGITLHSEDLTSVEQVRAALLAEKLKGTEAGSIAEADLREELRNVALYEQQEKEANEASEKLKSLMGSDKNPKVQAYVGKNVETFVWDGEKYEGYNLNGVPLKATDSIQFMSVDGKAYLFNLSDDLSSRMSVTNVYALEGDRWTQKVETVNGENLVPTQFRRFVFMKSSASVDCRNSWPDGKAKISYYEYGNNKGLPAIVPFDLRDGWYAMVPNSGGTFLEDSPQGYTASADVSYFKICNIGTNKLMESGRGDDLCQSFDINTVGQVDRFIPCPKLDSSKVRDLYTRAREAIRQASQQKEACSGTSKKPITILSQRIECGAPMGEVSGYECQDFMSPADCRLMFNVCDPVICPPSRCNLGGRMPVSDVIQTGIIGSLVLCLPNAAEGVAVPICVSGVAAGIDSFVSILEAERDCLNESLRTGQHVGICDEITAIYMCEFFWRQLSPVLDMLVPRLVESIYGGKQRVRGGGEYMLVQKSWDNLQKSIDYFQDTYAPNAFRAFKLRSTAEVGGEVCKAFVGTSFPTSAEAIDDLLEPESPSQFYAQFSETLFSEATVPSTSHYKVYYHIYAGNDVGAQYRVYLKNPPEYSYYASNPIVNVKTGYIAKGGYADESIDFTAPSGYKELCVVINAKEECGFTQVTSSFAVDYLSSKYVEDQANKGGIKTEKECISGSPSALSLANINVQQGIENTVNPQVNLNGIVRVCASVNPGQGVDSTRWKDVGYCGESQIRCWLDIESVEDDMKKIEAVENKSLDLLNQQRGLIEDAEITYEQAEKILSGARVDIKALTGTELKAGESNSKIKGILDELTRVTGTKFEDKNGDPGAGTNEQRAEALALKASIYRLITINQYEKKKAIVTEGPRPSENVPQEEKIPEQQKVLWADIVSAGLGESKNGALFVKIDGSFKSVKGAYDGVNQKLTVLINNKEEIYYVTKDTSGKIIFQKI